MSEPTKLTEADLLIEDSLTDLVMTHGVESVLKAAARVCRMGANLHNNAGEYGRAGDFNNYACTIENLFED